MTAVVVSSSSADVASSTINGAQIRETVVFAVVAVLLVALVAAVAASVWLAARRALNRRLNSASERVETIEMVKTPAAAWACMGTLESMLPVAGASADASEVVVECDIAMSRVNEPTGTYVAAPEPNERVSCDHVEECDITNVYVGASEPFETPYESKRLSWVEDDAAAPLWASLRRDESLKDESDKSQGFFQALAARW